MNYINANQLKEETGISYKECLRIISKAREEMIKRGMYIPKTRPVLVKKEIVKKILEGKL